MFSVANFCIAVVSYGAKRLQLWQGERPEQAPVTGVGERRIRNHSRLDGEEKKDPRSSLQACKAQLRWGCGLLALLLPQPQPQPLPGRMEGGQGREPPARSHRRGCPPSGMGRAERGHPKASWRLAMR